MSGGTTGKFSDFITLAKLNRFLNYHSSNEIVVKTVASSKTDAYKDLISDKDHREIKNIWWSVHDNGK